MRLTLVLVALVLTGCAAPDPNAGWAPGTPPEQKQAHRECSYQAEVATAGMRSVIEIAMTRGDLRRSCMAAKGYPS